MTALTLPNWRELYPDGPPDVRLDTVGPWCPIDDFRLDAEPIGWCCPCCGGGWNFHGRRGRWLPGGFELPARLAAEDAAEDEGRMPVGRRTTCRP
jgi:hypothetical protein